MMRRSVVSSNIDYSHRVQWKWALKHQQDTSPQTVIGALADGEDDDDFDDVDDDVAARIS
jgi:hypothetical protein